MNAKFQDDKGLKKRDIRFLDFTSSLVFSVFLAYEHDDIGNWTQDLVLQISDRSIKIS